MGFRGATSRRRAISVHTAIVSLVALAAVFVTLVLMHGMNDTRTMVAHAGVVPAETAFSTDAAQTPGDELDEPLTGVYATSLVVSSAQDDLAVPVRSPDQFRNCAADAVNWTFVPGL